MKKLNWLLMAFIFGLVVAVAGCKSDDDGDENGDDDKADDDDDSADKDSGFADDDDDDNGGDPSFVKSCDLSTSALFKSCVGKFLDCFNPNGECVIGPMPGGLKGDKVEFPLSSASIAYMEDGSGSVRSSSDLVSPCASFEPDGKNKRKWSRIVSDPDTGEQTVLEAFQEFELSSEGYYKSQKWTCPDGTVVEFSGNDARDVCLTSGADCSELEN